VKIEKLILSGEPGGYRYLEWIDEYGRWAMPTHGASVIGFAMGLFQPMTKSGEPHPELVTVPVYDDYINSGEEGSASYDEQTIIEPVLVEAYRRANAGWYADTLPGELELPTPGIWAISFQQAPKRERDI